MKSITIVAAALLGLSAGLVLSGRAEGQDARTLNGVVRAGRVTETYKIPTSVKSDGSPKPVERINDERTLVHVPDHYGDLVQVTAHGGDAVLWYRDSEGVLRNAILPRATDRLLRVAPVIAQKYDTDFR